MPLHESYDVNTSLLANKQRCKLTLSFRKLSQVVAIGKYIIPL